MKKRGGSHCFLGFLHVAPRGWPQKLSLDPSIQCHPIHTRHVGQPNPTRVRMRSRRRAVLMEQQTNEQEEGKRSLGTSHLGGWMGSHWLGCNVGKTIYLWVIVGTSPKDFPGTYIIPFQYWAIFLSLQINGGDPYQLLTIPGSPSSKQGFFFFSVEKNYGRIPPVLALMGCFTRNFGDREGSTHQLRETVGASRFVVKIDPLFTKVF